jgi:four helix bundle protein
MVLRQLAAGSWQLAVGSWQLAVGGWQLAAGGSPLAAGSWPLAAGRGRLAVGGWRGDCSLESQSWFPQQLTTLDREDCTFFASGWWQELRKETHMARVRFFRDLEAWRAAMDLAVAVHDVAAQFPTTHRFELAAQIRKAATSVPSNIAEGHAQHGDLVFLRHVRIALGSLAELDTQLELAVRLKLVEQEAISAFVSEIARTGKLLHGLRRTLRIATAKTAVTLLMLLSVAGQFLWF